MVSSLFFNVSILQTDTRSHDLQYSLALLIHHALCTISCTYGQLLESKIPSVDGIVL